MAEFKNRLEKNAVKGTCPHCQAQKTWRFFEGLHGNHNYGRCERVNSCPSGGKTFYPQSDSAPPSSGMKVINERVAVKIDPAQVDYITGDQTSPLHVFLLSKGISGTHLKKWNLGTDGSGKTVFFFRNREGDYINQKSGYYLEGGKRDKETGFFSLVQYLCTDCGAESIIKYKKCPGCSKTGTVKEHPSKVYKLCLYGEHLLDPEKIKPCYIVESEKTAIVASFFYPQADFVACGAASGLSDGTGGTSDKISPLMNRTIYWLSDADKAGRKNSSLSNLAKWGLKFSALDLFKERQDGWDLADEILSTGKVPELTEAESTSPMAILFIPAAARAEDGNDPIKDYENYGFYKFKNQYWKMVSAGAKGYTSISFSNFTMKVLFHMDNGKVPRRVIEMVNIHGRKKVVDTPTNNLGSRGKFIDFIEGNGNYQFNGTDGDLSKLKMQLFDQETTCKEITTLGWHDEKYFAWSNGIYSGGEFSPVSDNGFVQHKDIFLYIRAGNKNVPNRKTDHAGELKFRHVPAPVNMVDEKQFFKDWAARYYHVFGYNGMIVQLFTVACIFSDFIFSRRGFFPILFFYGEGGSGKGSAIKFAQYTFGEPQDPLTLSGKANTDKAKIATFAQLVNTMLFLEEYTPSHDTDQLLKNLYDRYGYKRRTMDASYRTESVPINSGVAVAGNYAPSDDPTLQRLLFLNHSSNEFTQDQKDLYSDLKNHSRDGITQVTHTILDQRAAIEKHFEDYSKQNYKKLAAQLKAVQCTDRMIENVTVLLTIYNILTESGLEFPYTEDTLVNHLVHITKDLNGRRQSGGEVQRFWDIFIYNINEEKIFHNRDFLIDGKTIYVRFTQVHQAYLQTHATLHRVNGLTRDTLLDKLKVHDSFIESVHSKRIGSGNSSAVSFNLDKTGVDISTDVVNLAAEFGRRRRGEGFYGGNVAAQVEGVSRVTPDRPTETVEDKPF